MAEKIKIKKTLKKERILKQKENIKIKVGEEQTEVNGKRRYSNI